MSKLLSRKVKRGIALLLAALMLMGSEETVLAASVVSELCEEAVSDVISEPEVRLDFTSETIKASEVAGVEVVSEQKMKEITGEVYPVDNFSAGVGAVSENDPELEKDTKEDINETANNDEGMEKTISGNEVSQDTISDKDVSQEIESGNIADTKEGFGIHPGKVMYGEDGSNTYGNLDDIFSPVWNYDGMILTSPGNSDSLADYNVLYKFCLENMDQETVGSWTEEKFHEFESVELESIDAGTTVTVIAMAQLKEDAAICSFAVDTFTICRREVYVKLNSNPEICIDAKELSEDGMISVPAASEYEYISIETVSDNGMITNTESVYALSADTLKPENAVTGDVVIDVTEIDTNVEGYQVFPVSMTFTEEFNKNYVVLGNIWGEVYTKKAHYYMSFTVKNNGESRTVTVDISSYTDKTVSEILRESGEYANVFPTFGGLIDETQKESIAAWQIHLDGSASKEYFEYYDEYDEYYWGYDWSPEQIQNYIINENGIKHDYFFVAKVMKYAADGLYITSIPEVYYDGRAHLVLGDWTNTKDKVSDIDLNIYSTEDNYELQYGTDYTVSYKNNKNATMKLDDEGRYVSLVTEDKKRPTVVIKGKGRYKGFSAEAYFDILPRNLGQYEYGNYSSSEKAEISGIKYSYALVDGKIKGTITPKVTKEYYCYSGGNRVDKLKEGKDYIAKLYRWNESGSYWEKQENSNPNKINRSGDYLYTIWGIGNYCGAVFGWGAENEFDDGKDSGTPNPVHLEHTETYSGGSYQFYVSEGDAYWDIANATITISKPTIKYDGQSHTARDFGLKVVIKSKGQTHVLTEGVDYKLELTDYRAYTYQQDGTTWVGHTYFTSATDITDGQISPASIKVANTYSVKITALGDKFFGYKDGSKKLRISGITPKKSYFQVTYKSADFNTGNIQQRWTLTRAALKAGLRNSYFGTYSYACNAAPGTYYSTLYAVYDGVDHDVSKEAKLSWKRKKMDLKTAVKKGYISFSVDSGNYKAKGSYPASINVGYNTYESGNRLIYMNYNGQSNTIYIPVGDSRSGYHQYVPLTLKITASNNNKVGDGAKLTIKASGLYSGSYTLTYSIQVKEMSETTIPVVTQDTYLIENNKRTSYIQNGTWAEGGYVYDGSIVAKIIDGNLSKGEAVYNPKVELYQAYYKNNSDFNNRRLSLARIKDDYFEAIADSQNGNTTRVRIVNNGHSYFAGVNYGDNVYVGSNYSVYEQAVTIVGATVVYNGREYIFQNNSKVSIPYEGRQIRFDRGEGNGITSVTVQLPDKNKTQVVLNEGDFTVYYNVNTSSGTNAGSFTVILNRNESDGTYRYGGSGQFKFSITDADKIVL